MKILMTCYLSNVLNVDVKIGHHKSQQELALGVDMMHMSC